MIVPAKSQEGARQRYQLWIDIYVSSGADVLGIDLSEDMIEQAKVKVAEKGVENKISFLQGDILANNFTLSDVYDIGLCVRFFNWVPIKDVFKIVTSLSKHSNSFLLIGCTIVPENLSLLNKIKARCRLFQSNRVRIRKTSAKRYIHGEKKFESFLQELNLKILEKKITLDTKYAVNYLYLIHKNNKHDKKQ